MFAQLQFIGNMTNKPKLTNKQDGTKIAHFSIAINQPGSNTADYVQCSVFDEAANVIMQYGEKGKQIFVQGFRYTLSTYVANDGTVKPTLSLLVSTYRFTGNKPQDIATNGNGKPNTTPATPATPTTVSTPAKPGDNIDDILANI